jgi:predicted DCC family thiol-disulfide oxidoreductase YuxK
MNYYSAYQFSLFHIIFGCYLLVKFLILIPKSSALFTSKTSFALYEAYPIISHALKSGFAAQIALVLLAFLSIFIILGRFRRPAALLIFLLYASLSGYGIVISPHGYPAIGWLLIACLVVPLGEPLRINAHSINKIWLMPWLVVASVWLLLILAFGAHSIERIFHIYWLNDSIFDLSLTWLILVLELFFVAFCFFSYTRIWSWLIAFIIIFLTGEYYLLLFLLLIFNAQWIPPRACVNQQQPIVFFDGWCGLCDKFVDFVLREDKYNIFLFSPLQGQTADAIIGNIATKELESIFLYDNKNLYSKSDAVLRIFSYLGGLWRLCSFMHILPKRWRDYIYNLVAQHRYKIFGKLEACKMPSSTQKARFLP